MPTLTEEMGPIAGHIDAIFKAKRGRPLSAATITKELAKRKQLPPLWTVLDVADYMKQWYGPAN